MSAHGVLRRRAVSLLAGARGRLVTIVLLRAKSAESRFSRPMPSYGAKIPLRSSRLAGKNSPPSASLCPADSKHPPWHITLPKACVRSQPGNRQHNRMLQSLLHANQRKPTLSGATERAGARSGGEEGQPSPKILRSVEKRTTLDVLLQSTSLDLSHCSRFSELLQRESSPLRFQNITTREPVNTLEWVPPKK